jgi:hypothetical protein
MLEKFLKLEYYNFLPHVLYLLFDIVQSFEAIYFELLIMCRY